MLTKIKAFNEENVNSVSDNNVKANTVKKNEKISEITRAKIVDIIKKSGFKKQDFLLMNSTKNNLFIRIASASFLISGSIVTAELLSSLWTTANFLVAPIHVEMMLGFIGINLLIGSIIEIIRHEKKEAMKQKYESLIIDIKIVLLNIIAKKDIVNKAIDEAFPGLDYKYKQIMLTDILYLNLNSNEQAAGTDEKSKKL